ncbi:MAG: hypothetical protein ACR2OU_19100 [Thermomicrobiales bacterium]
MLFDPSGAIAADMETRAREGLADGVVAPIGSRTAKATAPVGEGADRDRDTVDEADRIGTSDRDEVMPTDWRRDVGRWCAMHQGQMRLAAGVIPLK